jgi:hypothetical protein
MKCYWQIKVNNHGNGLNGNSVYTCTAPDKKAALSKFRSANPDLRGEKVKSIIKVY